MIEESAFRFALLAEPTSRQLGITFPPEATTSLTSWQKTCELSLRDVAPDVVAHRESERRGLGRRTSRTEKVNAEDVRHKSCERFLLKLELARLGLKLDVPRSLFLRFLFRRDRNVRGDSLVELAPREREIDKSAPSRGRKTSLVLASQT